MPHSCLIQLNDLPFHLQQNLSSFLWPSRFYVTQPLPKHFIFEIILCSSKSSFLTCSHTRCLAIRRKLKLISLYLHFPQLRVCYPLSFPELHVADTVSSFGFLLKDYLLTEEFILPSTQIILVHILGVGAAQAKILRHTTVVSLFGK